MTYTTMLSGVAGFAAGLVATPPAVLLGGIAGGAAAEATQCPIKNPFPGYAGGIAGATFLVGSLSNSAFHTGMKIATVVLSAIAGSLMKNNVRERNADREITASVLAWEIVKIIIGIFVGLVSAFTVHPIAGPSFGAITTYIMA